MRQCGLQGQSWIRQFAFGYPIAGELSRRFTYDRDRKYVDLLPRSALFESASARFKERAAKSGHATAHQLWGEAVQQVKKGWLCPPDLLDSAGKPRNSPSSRYNIAFRFGAKQDAELRACDDLKHSLANRCCWNKTPIKLVSWGHLAQLSSITTEQGDEWHLFKADHEDAYKQLPIAPDDQQTAIVALRNPTSGNWFGFATRTLVFGSVADVLRYNVLSRIWAALCVRLLGIPLVGHFDDFAALARAGLAEEAIRVFPRFCELLGFVLKPGKSSVGNSTVFLGLLGTFPSSANGHNLHIALAKGDGESGHISWTPISRRAGFPTAVLKT